MRCFETQFSIFTLYLRFGEAICFIFASKMFVLIALIFAINPQFIIRSSIKYYRTHHPILASLVMDRKL